MIQLFYEVDGRPQVYTLIKDEVSIGRSSENDVVLNDFSKASGGQRDFVIGIAAVPDILKAYANALAMQYEVVFKRPENAKSAKVIQVGTRPGLKVHASSAAPK